MTIRFELIKTNGMSAFGTVRNILYWPVSRTEVDSGRKQGRLASDFDLIYGSNTSLEKKECRMRQVYAHYSLVFST